MRLAQEHLEAIQILADTVRICENVALDNFAQSLDALPCPKRFQRALQLGKLLMETGQLDPNGHGQRTVCNALALVESHRPLFDELFSVAVDCSRCED